MNPANSLSRFHSPIARTTWKTTRGTLWSGWKRLTKSTACTLATVEGDGVTCFLLIWWLATPTNRLYILSTWMLRFFQTKKQKNSWDLRHFLPVLGPSISDIQDTSNVLATKLPAIDLPTCIAGWCSWYTELDVGQTTLLCVDYFSRKSYFTCMSTETHRPEGMLLIKTHSRLHAFHVSLHSGLR